MTAPSRIVTKTGPVGTVVRNRGGSMWLVLQVRSFGILLTSLVPRLWELGIALVPGVQGWGGDVSALLLQGPCSDCHQITSCRRPDSGAVGLVEPRSVLLPRQRAAGRKTGRRCRDQPVGDGARARVDLHPGRVLVHGQSRLAVGAKTDTPSSPIRAVCPMPSCLAVRRPPVRSMSSD